MPRRIELGLEGSPVPVDRKQVLLDQRGQDIEAFDRHFPDDIQNRGNLTTGPPPRERHPFRSHRAMPESW